MLCDHIKGINPHGTVQVSSKLVRSTNSPTTTS